MLWLVKIVYVKVSAWQEPSAECVGVIECGPLQFINIFVLTERNPYIKQVEKFKAREHTRIKQGN
jgi:hypothetical protein